MMKFVKMFVNVKNMFKKKSFIIILRRSITLLTDGNTKHKTADKSRGFDRTREGVDACAEQTVLLRFDERRN